MADRRRQAAQRRVLIAALLVAMAVVPAGAAAGTPTPNVPPEGFTALFNGKDLTGWMFSAYGRRPMDGGDKYWKVVDGVIQCRGFTRQHAPNLWTTKAYTDYVLRLDWRIPPGVKKSNSGIFPGGGQVEIWNQDMGSGAIAVAGGGKEPKPAIDWSQPRLAKTPKHIRAHVDYVPSKKADRPTGQWNTFEITVRGDRITVALNGEVVVDGARLFSRRRPHPIGLQKHGYGQPALGMPMDFRSIYIKELSRADQKRPRTQPTPQTMPSSASARRAHRPPGFTALFNGKDFTGWRGYGRSEEWKKHWTIDRGVLRSHSSCPRGTPPASPRTVKEYGDFALAFDVRFPDRHSDSGILTRLGQINLMPSWPAPVGLEIHPRRYPEHRAAARKQLAAAKVPCAPGRWYHVELTVRGQAVSVKIDGKVVLDAFEMPEAGTPTGPIGLQKHPDKPDYSGKTDKTFACSIEFRNVYVKPLGGGE